MLEQLSYDKGFNQACLYYVHYKTQIVVEEFQHYSLIVLLTHLSLLQAGC